MHLFKRTQLKYLFIGIWVVLIGIIFTGAYIRSKSASNVVVPLDETAQHEQKHLPEDVKQSIALSTPSASYRIPILMYHYIEYVQDKKDTMRVALNVTPDVLEKQIQTLQQAHYSFLTSKDVGDILDNKESMPQKPVVLTFDDGHRDFYTNVFPILKKYNIKATNYIITGFLGGSDFMTKEQVADLQHSGMVEIGAHTVHHIALKGKKDDLVRNEIAGSKEWLEKTYGISVYSFAYPSGSFDLQAVSEAKSAGFLTAVSTLPGIEQNDINKYFLYRLRPGYRIGDSLLTWIQGSVFGSRHG